jgi:retron-type reverse transcriptase
MTSDHIIVVNQSAFI